MSTNLRTFARTFAAVLLAGLLLPQAAPRASGPATDGALPKPFAHDGESKVLPGGRSVTPAGTQIEVLALPLGVATAPDGIHVLVTNNGIVQNCLSWIDAVAGVVKQTICPMNTDGELGVPPSGVPNALSFGIVFLPEPGSEGLPFTGRIYVSGANKGNVLVFGAVAGVITAQPLRQIPVAGWPAGMALADGRIWVARLLSEVPSDPNDPQSPKTGCVAVIAPGAIPAADVVENACVRVGSRPWAVAAGGGLVYVANRGADSGVGDLAASQPPRGNDDTISVLDPASTSEVAAFPVGDHPAGLAARDGSVFVSNANSDDLTILKLDTSGPTPVLASSTRIDLEAYPGGGFGTFPTAIVPSADGARLYVASSGINAITVIDLERENGARVVGHVPTGWYPSALALSNDGSRLFVTNARRALPRGQLQNPDFAFNYGLFVVPGGGTAAVGTLSRIDLEAAHARLGDLTEQVRINNRLPRLTASRAEGEEPTACADLLPAAVCDGVEFVFYAVRENKTYDQVLGDLLDEYPADRVSIGPDGNLRARRPDGDPTLVFWPEPFTANAHKLARDFVLMDRYFTETEVSEQGHQWSSGSIVSDYFERMWPLPKGFRGESEDEGGEMVKTPSNYLFENFHRNGIPWRNYGERSARLPVDGDGNVVTYAPATNGFVGDVPETFYPRGGYALPDELRVRGCTEPGGCDVGFVGQTHHFDPFEGWLGTFQRDLGNCLDENGAFVADGCTLPAFSYLILGRDHTSGVTAPPDTAQEQIADNDRAIGFLVQEISSRPEIWKRSAIFIIEDDPQSGADHVDAHRSIALVASPWVKRGYLSSRHYSMSGLIRAMELLVDAPPMNLYDAHAEPLTDIWVSEAAESDPSPYQATFPLIPPQPPVPEELVAASLALGIADKEYDSVPDAAFNRILCQYVKAVLRPDNRCDQFLR